MTMPYYDKNGDEIKSGMYLRMNDGEIERIYDCYDPYDETELDLGINASNEAYLWYHCFGCEDFCRECYSLSLFNLSNAEICQPELAETENTATGLWMEMQ